MTDDVGHINSFAVGATVRELRDLLNTLDGETRLRMSPLTGGGCYLITVDQADDRDDILWYDL